MNTDSHSLTRRQALLGTLASGVAAALLGSTSAPGAVSSPEARAPEPEYVPENDYPFFGYEPDAVPPARES